MNPNRLAALSGVLAAVVGALVSLLGAVDTYEKAIVLAVALLVSGAVLIVWLIGWQKHETRVAVSLPQVAPPVGTEEVEGLSQGVKADGPTEGTDG